MCVSKAEKKVRGVTFQKGTGIVSPEHKASRGRERLLTGSHERSWTETRTFAPQNPFPGKSCKPTLGSPSQGNLRGAWGRVATTTPGLRGTPRPGLAPQHEPEAAWPSQAALTGLATAAVTGLVLRNGPRVSGRAWTCWCARRAMGSAQAPVPPHTTALHLPGGDHRRDVVLLTIPEKNGLNLAAELHPGVRGCREVSSHISPAISLPSRSRGTCAQALTRSREPLRPGKPPQSLWRSALDQRDARAHRQAPGREEDDVLARGCHASCSRSASHRQTSSRRSIRRGSYAPTGRDPRPIDRQSSDMAWSRLSPIIIAYQPGITVPQGRAALDSEPFQKST